MNYSRKPIIVLGLNHSGTRVLVDILTILGSNPGDVSNSWRENILFLNIHKKLISKISDRGWDKTIFDPDFINHFIDKKIYTDYIENILDKSLKNHYENFQSTAWHWKCPTSSIFLNTWGEIFPDAYYIIIKRSKRENVISLIKNLGPSKIKKCEQLYSVVNEKIDKHSLNNSLNVNYENLINEVDNIAEFIPISVSKRNIKLAKDIIHEKYNVWSLNKSIYNNFKYISYRLYHYAYMALE